MAAGNYNNGKDSFEISELAALNEDISNEFIEQLQNQLTGSVDNFSQNSVVNENDDTTLFEETTPQNIAPAAEPPVQEQSEEAAVQEPTPAVNIDIPETEKKENNVNTNFDDNFTKKYKAKLNKKSQSSPDSQDIAAIPEEVAQVANNDQIENITKGNITEKNLSKEQKDYNDSLDFLDGNVKYSKYVIYIDPQNVDFIEGLTVKERKNLINGILRQQDDITITKQRFKVLLTVLRQVIVAVLTIAIAIPIVYTAINASLEATINNHRSAQTNWQALYREHGKITQN